MAASFLDWRRSPWTGVTVSVIALTVTAAIFYLCLGRFLRSNAAATVVRPIVQGYLRGSWDGPNSPGDKIQRITFDELPAVAAADATFQANIILWSDAARKGETVSSQDSAAICASASEARLPASTLVAIASCLAESPKVDNRLVGCLAAHAAEEIHSHLPDLSPDTPTYVYNLRLLIQCKALLWHTIEHGQPDFARQQLVVCDDLGNCFPAKDPILHNAKIHGMIGGAECLYLLKRNQDAIDRLDKLSLTERLDSSQLLAASWARGLSSFTMGQFSDAASCFEKCALSNGYLHQADATCFALMSKVRSGGTQDTVVLARQLESKFPNAAFAKEARNELAVALEALRFADATEHMKER